MCLVFYLCGINFISKLSIRNVSHFTVNLIDSSSRLFSLQAPCLEAAPGSFPVHCGGSLWASFMAALGSLSPVFWISQPLLLWQLTYFRIQIHLFFLLVLVGYIFQGDSPGKRLLHLYTIRKCAHTLNLLFGLDKLLT